MSTSSIGLVKSKCRRERFFVGLLFSIVFLFVSLFLPLNPQPVLAALATIDHSSMGEPRLAFRMMEEPSTFKLSDFVAASNAADPEQIVGVYVAGVFALPVIQQPEDKPWFVSSEPNIITQFGLASDYGSMGFLAHNTLAGSVFHELQIGQEVRVIQADGESKRYIVDGIMRYQALDPTNPYSSFRAMDGKGKDLSSTDLFKLVYAVPDRVVFQTCIEQGGNPNWGRYFVIAYPVRERFSLFELLSF